MKGHADIRIHRENEITPRGPLTVTQRYPSALTMMTLARTDTIGLGFDKVLHRIPSFRMVPPGNENDLGLQTNLINPIENI